MRNYKYVRARRNSKSFASGLNFYKLIWIFILVSVLGFLLETVYFFINDGSFEIKKGLIYGPFNPVYGLGAIVLVVFLENIPKINDFFVFVISTVLSGVCAYLFSWIQERFLCVVFWDYSSQPLNFSGRISVKQSVVLGILGFVFMKYIYEFMGKKIESIPEDIGKIGAWIIFLFIVFDIFISVLAVKRKVERVSGAEAQSVFEKFLDETYGDNFLDKIYPKMQIRK